MIALRSQASASVSRGSVRARGLPSRACEAGAPCHRLYARRERLQSALSDAIKHAELVRAEATREAMDVASDLRHAMDVIEEMRTAITRLENRLEECIIEYDYLTFEDQEVLMTEREYDL